MRPRMLLLVIALALPAALSAQDPRHGPDHPMAGPGHDAGHDAMHPGDDPFGHHLFPPELVMSNQLAIGLQDAQRAKISAELQDAQATFTQLQMQLGAQTERMGQLLGADNVDEGAVLAQVDRILDLERQVKKRQVALLIRIRNVLTPEQRAKLATLRGQS